MTDFLDTQILFTQGVLARYPVVNELLHHVYDDWKKQPDEVFDGGNDKKFFVSFYHSDKLYVVYDPAYSPETHAVDHSKPETYTIMFADEY